MPVPRIRTFENVDLGLLEEHPTDDNYPQIAHHDKDENWGDAIVVNGIS